MTYQSSYGGMDMKRSHHQQAIRVLIHWKAPSAGCFYFAGQHTGGGICLEATQAPIRESRGLKSDIQEITRTHRLTPLTESVAHVTKKQREVFRSASVYL